MLLTGWNRTVSALLWLMPALPNRLMLNWSDLATTHDAFMIVEESSPGGFSAHLLQFLAAEGLLDKGLKLRVASLPDEYIDHADGAAS